MAPLVVPIRMSEFPILHMDVRLYTVSSEPARAHGGGALDGDYSTC